MIFFYRSDAKTQKIENQHFLRFCVFAVKVYFKIKT